MSKLTPLETAIEERRVTFNEDRNIVYEVERYLNYKQDIWKETWTRTDEYYEIQEIEIILSREEFPRNISFDFVDWEYWDTHENLGEMISKALQDGQRRSIYFLEEGEQKRELCVGDFFQLLGYEIGEVG